ncbi:MAG: hypothetical protein JRJ19_10880 [Deltaproteobacteria bacterium]|nr:hypothetical protein [Deltaproteobacteria bacterium]MBW1872562.1 hypothetical protein [Deltaproteobacteria bacterium]
MAGQKIPGIQEVLDDLKRSARALDAYSEDIVLAGGLVPLCYRKIYVSELEDHKSLFTFDVDWAVPNKVPLKEGQSVVESIRSAGYQEVLSHLVVPPVAKYQHERFDPENPAPVYLEFITDRAGGPRSRTGNDQSSMNVQSGFRVVALPYVRILLGGTLDFDLAELDKTVIEEPLQVQVPHPANYVLHKLLVSEKRAKREKHDKDLAYVYDVALVTQNDWGAIGKRLKENEVTKKYPAKWLKDARRIVSNHFRDETSDGPIVISRIYRSIAVPVSESGAYRVMADFFQKIGLE